MLKNLFSSVNISCQVFDKIKYYFCPPAYMICLNEHYCLYAKYFIKSTKGVFMAKKKSGTKKSSAEKKTASKVKIAAKPKSVARDGTSAKTPVKTAGTKKAENCVEELILKKFETWRPEKIFEIETEMKNFTAPPFFENKEKAKQISGLLFKQFDLRASDSPEKRAVPKKALSVTELALKKFGVWQPETLFSVKPDKGEFTAPPLFDDTDKAKKTGALLCQKFDLKTFPKKAVSVGELLSKKFGQWQPETLFSVKPDKGEFTAPPLFDDTDKAKKTGALLCQKFDLKTFPKKAVSVGELLSKKFGVWQPETLFSVKPDKGEFTAPPLFDDTDKAKKTGALLCQKFDLKTFPKKAVSVGELLLKKFGVWQPETLFSVKPDKGEFTAPPLFDDTDKAKKTGALLCQKFDLKTFPKKAVSVGELLSKKFGQWQPETLFSVKPDKGEFTAPPLFDDTDKAKKTGDLLCQKFDLKTFPKKAEGKPAAVKEVKPVAPKRVMPLNELILMKFDQWKPENLFSVKPEKEEFSAPPLFDDTDKTKKASALLFQVFDLKTFPRKSDVKPATEKIKEIQPVVKETEKVCECDAPQGKKPVFFDPAMKLFITVFIILVTLISAVSYSNFSKYYVQSKDNAVEILQGKFAPKGKETLAALTGVKTAVSLTDKIYSKEEISYILVRYFGNITSRLNEPPSHKNLKEAEAYLNTMASVVSKRDMRNTFKAAAKYIRYARRSFEYGQMNLAKDQVRLANDLLNNLEVK